MRLSHSCLTRTTGPGLSHGLPLHHPQLLPCYHSPSRTREIPPLKSHQGRRARGQTEGPSKEGQGRRGNRVVRDGSPTGSRWSTPCVPFSLPRSSYCARVPSTFCLLNVFFFPVGQILRLVQIPDKILPRFGARCGRRALLSFSASVATDRNEIL